MPAGSEITCLDILICVQGQSLHHEKIGTEIVEGAILIAEDFQRHWRDTHIIVVGPNPDAWFRSFDLDVVGNGPVWAVLDRRVFVLFVMLGGFTTRQ